MVGLIPTAATNIADRWTN